MAGVLILAHAPLAGALRAVAAHVYDEAMGRIAALDVDRDAVPAQVESEARASIARLDQPEVLILTDVIGATPFNIGLELANGSSIRMVTGVNVPMLWRTLCYLDEPLAQLVARAVDGATQGVMQIATPRPQNQNRNGPDDQDSCHHQQ